jgi:hypothetical protein
VVNDLESFVFTWRASWSTRPCWISTCLSLRDAIAPSRAPVRAVKAMRARSRRSISAGIVWMTCRICSRVGTRASRARLEALGLFDVERLEVAEPGVGFEPIQSLHDTVERWLAETFSLGQLADLLAIEDGDLEQAPAQLDILFTQGRHTPDLMVSLIAVNTLLGKTGDATGFLDALKAATPSEMADAVSARVVEYIKKITDRHLPADAKRSSGKGTRVSAKTDPPGSGSSRPSRNETAERSSGDAVAARGKSGGNQDGPKLRVCESAILLEEGSRLPMIGWSAYFGANIFAMDYYDELGVPNYAARFAAAFRRFTRDSVLRQGPLSLRNSPFRFVRCTHCAFTVFSNRAGDEQLLCRMCDERGPLSPAADPDLDRLATRCETDSGLVRESLGGTPVVFAAVLPDLSYAPRVIAVCEQLGWMPADRRDHIGSFLKFLAMPRRTSSARRLIAPRSTPLDSGKKLTATIVAPDRAPTFPQPVSFRTHVPSQLERE